MLQISLIAHFVSLITNRSQSAISQGLVNYKDNNRNYCTSLFMSLMTEKKTEHKGAFIVQAFYDFQQWNKQISFFLEDFKGIAGSALTRICFFASNKIIITQNRRFLHNKTAVSDTSTVSYWKLRAIFKQSSVKTRP